MGLNLNLQGIRGEIVRQHSWFLSLSWLDLCANLQRGETDSIQIRIWLRDFFGGGGWGGCFCMPDLSVKHEGYVERHWLDYDETLRNDAFLKDIFTAVQANAPITLTRGGAFTDPSGKSFIAGNIRLDSCFEGKTHCAVFPETAWSSFFLLTYFIFSILFAVWLCLPLFLMQNICCFKCSPLLYRHTYEAFALRCFKVL